MKVKVEIASEMMWWTAFMITQRAGPRRNSRNRTSGSRSRSYGLRYSRTIIAWMSPQARCSTSKTSKSGSTSAEIRCTARPASSVKFARRLGWRSTIARKAVAISSGSSSTRTSTAPPML